MQQGVSPREVDRLELWQAMAALGQHRHPEFWAPKNTTDASGAIPSQGGPSSGEDRIRASADLFAARRARAAAGLPPPEPVPGRDVGVQSLMGALARG